MVKPFIFLVTAALLYARPACGQPFAQSDFTKANMHGKIKSVKYYEYRDRNDTGRATSFYEFNEDGKEIKHRYYFASTLVHDALDESKYGANGKIAEIIHYQYIDGRAVPDQREEFIYDSHGNETDYTEYDVKQSKPERHTVSNYDPLHHIVSSYTTDFLGDTVAMRLYEQGNMVKWVSYEFETIETRDYKYDDPGRVVWEEYYTKGRYSTEKDKAPRYNKYAYDKKGRLAREEFGEVHKDSVDSYGKRYHPVVTTYTYDEHGNWIDSEDNIGGPKLSAHRYEYDKQGNWIRKYSVDSGRLEERRVIAYYH